MPSWKNTSNFDNYKQGYISPLQKYKEIINKKPFCLEMFHKNLGLTDFDLFFAVISKIMRKDTLIGEKKQRQMRMSHLSI